MTYGRPYNQVKIDLEAAGDVKYVTSLDQDVPFSLTAEQPDYVDRFILNAIGKATSAAALSGHFSAKEVARIFFEKTQSLRDLDSTSKCNR